MQIYLNLRQLYLKSIKLNFKKSISTNLNFSTVKTQAQVTKLFQPVINTVNVSANILSALTQTQQRVGFQGTTILFPLSGTPIGTPPPTPQPYTGNTSGGGTYGPQPTVPPID